MCPPASAQTVVCANCGSEYTQWLNYLQLVRQLEKQAALVQNAIRNTTALPNFKSGDGLSDIRAVTAILAQAKSLSYASADLDARFARSSRTTTAMRPPNSTTRPWRRNTSSGLRTRTAAPRRTLKAAGLQAKQIEGAEEQTLQALESQAASVEGIARRPADGAGAVHRDRAPAAEAAPAGDAEHAARGQLRPERAGPERRRAGRLAAVHHVSQSRHV